MGIFSRFRDIVNSNLNAMLDKAEDPEKLIKLMIREMEDTLVELKASCAGALAAKARSSRQLEEVDSRTTRWQERAEMALLKGREDLAREALLEKRASSEQARALAAEQANLDSVVDKYKADIVQLEEKLDQARNKHRVLVQRHVQAQNQRRAQEDIRRVHSASVMGKFDAFEDRIERMEAGADLVNYGVPRGGLDETFARFETDDEIERELEALRQKAESGRQG